MRIKQNMRKKILIISIIAILILGVFIGCGGKEEQADPTPTPTIAVKEPTTVASNSKLIGLSLSDETPFNKEFQRYFEEEYINSEYDVVTMYADGDYDKQVSDLADMLTKVEILILDPSDLDNLEYILSEYEVNNVPVINLTESVNAYTKMLIGPFYKNMGLKIGNHTFDKLSELTNRKTSVVILRGSVDSSKMQGVYDGIIKSLEGYKYSELIEAPACNYDYDRTKEHVTRILQENAKVDCIFAETSQMAIAAIDAIDESEKSGIFITTMGADRDCLALIEDRRIDASIFYGPNDLATVTSNYANRILEDNEVILPQFVELNYEIITSRNVENYFIESTVYAIANTGTDLPADPTPTPAPDTTDEVTEAS
jgi:ABC-type sugar transport system substrate-binding protein